MAVDKGIWWVNLGKAYAVARQRGELWSGTQLWHQRMLEALRAGDIVFTFANGEIHGFCVVDEPAEWVDSHVAPDQPALPPAERLLVKAVFYEFDEPVGVDEIPLEWRQENTTTYQGPFQTAGGRVHQIYLARLLPTFYDQMKERFADRWPLSATRPKVLA